MNVNSKLRRQLKRAESFEFNGTTYYKISNAKKVRHITKQYNLKRLLWQQYSKEELPDNSVIVCELPTGELSTEYWCSDPKKMTYLTLSAWRLSPSNPLNQQQNNKINNL